MYDFLNAIGGMGFAILGAALTVGLCCVGSAKGTGLVGEAAAGLVSEDPDKSTKCLILQVLPGTQGLYGFVALFIVLLQVGLMSGTPVDLTLTQGMSFFAACIPTAIGGCQVPGPCGRRLRGYRGQAPGGRHQGPDLLRYRGVLRYFVPGGYHHAGYQHSVKRSRP